jgi:hypothetical protein
MTASQLRPPPIPACRPALPPASQEVRRLAEQDLDLEVFATRAYRVKTFTAPLTAMAAALVVLGGLAYFMYREMPPIAIALGVAIFLIEVYIVGLAVPDIRRAFRSGPMFVLSRPGLWIAGIGWIDWDEIERLVDFRVGNEGDIGIVAKNPTLLKRLPLLARISAVTAGLPWAGSVVTIPHDRLSVAGDDLLEYIRIRYGLTISARRMT